MKWFKVIFDIDFVLTKEIVILNNYVGQFKDTINICILIAKQYMYAQKWLNSNIKINQYANSLFTMYNLEKIAAQNTNSLSAFHTKWSVIKHYCTWATYLIINVRKSCL